VELQLKLAVSTPLRGGWSLVALPKPKMANVQVWWCGAAAGAAASAVGSCGAVMGAAGSACATVDAASRLTNAMKHSIICCTPFRVMDGTS
jgi:hypothetical protein